MLFIHQYPDWTHFRFSWSQILTPLCQIRFLQGRLQGMAHFAAAKNLEESVRQQDAEASFLIDGKKNVPALFHSAVKNFHTAMDEKRLLALHANLFSGKKNFRELPDVTDKNFNGFSGISPERIPLEMSKFFAYLNESPMDKILQAAIVEFWFLVIRPFSSGNGILSRLLADMLISQSENSARRFYSLNTEILNDKDAYFSELAKAQQSNGEISSWILWFLNKMEKSLLRSEKEMNSLFCKTKQQLAFSGIPITDREKNLLEILQQDSEKTLSSSAWAKLSDISHDSALRDLADLVKKGILKKAKGKGRSTRYQLADISSEPFPF